MFFCSKLSFKSTKFLCTLISLSLCLFADMAAACTNQHGMPDCCTRFQPRPGFSAEQGGYSLRINTPGKGFLCEGWVARNVSRDLNLKVVRIVEMPVPHPLPADVKILHPQVDSVIGKQQIELFGESLTGGGAYKIVGRFGSEGSLHWPTKLFTKQLHHLPEFRFLATTRIDNETFYLPPRFVAANKQAKQGEEVEIEVSTNRPYTSLLAKLSEYDFKSRGPARGKSIQLQPKKMKSLRAIFLVKRSEVWPISYIEIGGCAVSDCKEPFADPTIVRLILREPNK